MKQSFDSGYSTPHHHVLRSQSSPPSSFQPHTSPTPSKRCRSRTPTLSKLSLNMFSSRHTNVNARTPSHGESHFSPSGSDYFSSPSNAPTPTLLSPASIDAQGFTSPFSDFCPPTPRDTNGDGTEPEKKEGWFRTRSRRYTSKAGRMRSFLTFSPKPAVEAEARRESWLEIGEAEMQAQYRTMERDLEDRERTVRSRPVATPRKSSREMLAGLNTGLGIVGEFGAIGGAGLLPAAEIGELSGANGTAGEFPSLERVNRLVADILVLGNCRR